MILITFYTAIRSGLSVILAGVNVNVIIQAANGGYVENSMHPLHGTERIIYEYIIYHADQLGVLSAKTIANATYSTTTSVNRVCKKMGYESYTEMRYRLPYDLRVQNTAAVSPYWDQANTDDFCRQVRQASMVFLYARGATNTSMNYLARFLSLASIPYLSLTDEHQLTRAAQGVLVLLSKSGETPAMLAMAHNAKHKGMTILAITRQDSSLFALATTGYGLTIPQNGFSIYQRESQMELLTFIDAVGQRLV